MAVRLGGGYLQIENDRALASTAALTYSAWVRVPATCPVADGCTRARWIDKGPWFSLEAVRGHAHLQMSFQNLGPFKSQMGIPKGDVWTHVAVTYEATAIKFYVDGKLNRSHLPGGVQFNLKPNPSPLRLGAKQSTTPGDFYEGDLDLVRLYRRALAAEEVAAEARQQYAPCAKATACVVEWTFDDAEGARAPSSGGAALIGQLAGGYEIVDGLVGKALRLRRGWMDVPPDPALDFGDAFTFSAWLRRGPACPADRPDKCYLERLFGKGGSLIGEIREGNWRVIIDDKFMLSPSNSGAPPGRWAHLAIACDHRDGLKIYLDGKLVRGWGVGKPDNLCYNCPGNPS